MNIPALQKRLRDFAAARDWQPLHTPKNLAMALMVEAAELLELFQWLTTAESHTLTKVNDDKERVGDEIADVLLYLLQLADHTGVNMEDAVERKLRKNAEKHPAKYLEKPVPEPTVHVFVDWENVQPKGDELRTLVPGATQVWLFHGPAQKVDASTHRVAYGGSEVTLVPRSGSGKNALDFQLSYYIGYISSRHPQAQFVVVSNDTGYDSMLEHARELGFDARRCGFQKPAAKPAISVVKKASAKPKAQPFRPGPSQPDPTAAQIAWRAIAHLRQLPSSPENLQGFLESLIHEPVLDKAMLAHRAFQLLHMRAWGRFTPKEALQVVPPPAAVPTVQPPPAPTGKAPAKKSATKKIASPAQVAQRVLASLKKMPNNKPMRKAGLLKHIETHLDITPDRVVRAQQVFSVLQSKKQVALSADGLRISYPGFK